MATENFKSAILPRLSLGKIARSKQRIFIGLSGGVDSAVSAALLKNDFDVVGVFIKVWTPDFLPCTWREDRRDAMRVCAHLDILFMTLDLEKEYKKEVVDYMIREYKVGRTPNPDVMCNKEIKFGAFYDFAMKRGADYVATGHYAQIVDRRTQNKEPNAPRFTLHASQDASKDQSYFLWNIKNEQLSHVLFPIGGMVKPEVRKIAKKFKLPNAEKKDSQGLCFLGKVDMKDFLKHFIKEKKGIVLDVKGNVIGTHTGAVFLTIGQRHGFVTENQKTLSKPLFIIAKDVKKNTITVSPRNIPSGGLGKFVKKTCVLSDTNWLEEPKKNKIYDICFRYHQAPLRGTIKKINLGEKRILGTSQDRNATARGMGKRFFNKKILLPISSGNHGQKWAIELERPFAGISPGQSAVVYCKQRLVGGGVIQ